MIIPCMNCTSASECGGNVGLVEGGNVRVGWPGAPGCTITGGLACCAKTGSDNRHARVAAGKSPFRHIAKHFIDLECSSMEDFTLSQKRRQNLFRQFRLRNFRASIRVYLRLERRLAS